jgi:hypothetical protein
MLFAVMIIRKQWCPWFIVVSVLASTVSCYYCCIKSSDVAILLFFFRVGQLIVDPLIQLNRTFSVFSTLDWYEMWISEQLKHNNIASANFVEVYGFSIVNYRLNPRNIEFLCHSWVVGFSSKLYTNNENWCNFDIEIGAAPERIHKCLNFKWSILLA